MDDQLTEQQEIISHPKPAPLAKRTIAFFMDAVLLFILIQLIALLIPKLYDENSVNEFNKLIHRVSLLSEDDRLNSTEMTAFIEGSQLSSQTYEMIVSMAFVACALPILYFFCGETFFQGQTLGKATFGLRTVLVRNYQNVPIGKILIRSIIKGFATITLVTPFLLPGILNFCFCLLNQKKRCVHDILSGTITVRPNL